MELPDRVFRPPRFRRQNPEAWISKVELYMMGLGAPEHRKLFWALACFEDDYSNLCNYLPGSAAPGDWEGESLKYLMRKQPDKRRQGSPTREARVCVLITVRRERNPSTHIRRMSQWRRNAVS